MEVNPATGHVLDLHGAGSHTASAAAARASDADQADTFQADDTVSVFGGYGRQVGQLQFDASGAYRVVNAEAMRAHAGSLPPSAPSLQSVDVVQLDNALGPSPERARMQDVMNQLGLDERSARDLKLVSELIEKLDPTSFESLMQRLQGISQAYSTPEPRRVEPSQPRAADEARAAAGLQVSYLALELSVSDTWPGEDASGEEGSASMHGRRQALRFERLELSLGQSALDQGGALTLDVAGSREQARVALVGNTQSDAALLSSVGLGDLAAGALVQRSPVERADGSSGSLIDVLVAGDR
ncbi:MAG: hypothetical protein U1E76_07895 [Planctomycetota bacterium]